MMGRGRIPVIICSCNLISKTEIEAVILSLLSRDPWHFITPDLIYAALRKQGQCCGCFPGVSRIILQTTRHFHRTLGVPESETHAFLQQMEAGYRDRTPAPAAPYISNMGEAASY